MSGEVIPVEKIDITKVSQDLSVNREMKMKYGEIFTPYSLIKEMFGLFHQDVFSDPEKKWLDTGAGSGFFSIYLFHLLDYGLKRIISNSKKRHAHIKKKMIYMVEIRDENIEKLKKVFGKNANIFHENFLSEFAFPEFDYIIGNPPYNCDGIKKVPTNTKQKKKNDGQTIWFDFIKRSISLLKPTGKLLYIVPSLWMKPDRARIYYYLTSYKLHRICCLTNTETNTYFKREAQTPTCYFLLEKAESDKEVMLLDRERKAYVYYSLLPEKPIPLFASYIVSKLRPFVEKAGCLQPIKTNMPPTGSMFSDTLDKKTPYINIKTCRLNGLKPHLVINYSNKRQPHYGIPKLILAHKMYGFPFIDSKGIYGISNRDNYVFVNKTINDYRIIRDFLSTKTALYLYESTRYRMKYLEKYAFEFIPDVTCLPDFPSVINDDTIADYFGFDDIDKKNIQTYHKKPYQFDYSTIT